MAGNGLELEQMIEIVDSTNNLIGYVSGTLPNANTNHDNIIMIDTNDELESDSHSDTLSIWPEAPPEIPADKDIVMIDHTDANLIVIVIHLVLGQMLHPPFLLTHYQLKKAHMMKLKHMKL